MNRTKLTPTVALLCAVIAGVPAVALAEGATIKGTIKWEGKLYKGKRMKNMNVQCTGFHEGKPPRKESVVTNKNGTLRNVFVYVKNAPKGDYAVPSSPVVLHQKGCLYSPHVLGIQVGQALEIRNDDPTAHNVHFVPKKNKEYNKSQPKIGLVNTLIFKRPEVMVPVKCDVHPWMSAYVGVLKHPFFSVSDDEGAFEIKGLPAGKYTIEAWHEKYGKKTMEVEVAVDETKTVEFTYSRPAKKKKK